MVQPIPTVLIVDDEPDMLLLVRLELEMAGLDVVAEAVDGRAALDAYEQLKAPPIPDVVVLDNRMPGLTGLEVARRMLDRVPSQRIVLFTAFVDDDLREDAKEAGIHSVLSKSDVFSLATAVRETLT